MKFSAVFRSRPRLDESIQAKHASFAKAVGEMADPWGFIGELPPAPDIGHDLIKVIRLRGCLSDGIKGEVAYVFREPDAADIAANDDHLSFKFNPAKVDYQGLVGKAFAYYSRAFRAYRAEIFDTEFYSADFDQQRLVNDRKGVYRICPVAFYDRELCHRAFRLSPEVVVARLVESGLVERAEMLGDGVLIVASSAALPYEEAAKVDERLRPLLAQQDT